MQGLYLLLTVVSVATAYVTYPSPATVNGIDCPIHPGCPAVDDPQSTFHIADEENCHQFYKCVAGRGCRQECPLDSQGQSRLVFNPNLQVCDWPQNVPEAHCRDEASTAVAEPVTVPSEAGASTKPTPTPATAATPTHATATKPTPSSSTPSSAVATATPNIPSTVPGKCAAQGNLSIPHETDCRAYYECHNGYRSEVRYCLEGNVFNPIQHTCDLLTNDTIKYCPNPSTPA